MKSPWAWPSDDRIADSLPPGCGEPEPANHSFGAGSNVGFERCPECGSLDLSYDGPGWLAEFAQGQPDTPLVCEDCPWSGTQAETI